LPAHAEEKPQPLPLSSAYWRDPAFLKAFNGSYRIEARIEPNVTTEERGLLVEVQELMAKDDRKGAIRKLEGSDLTAKSPALTFNLANLHFEEAELDKAIDGYRKAIAEMPAFRRAQRNLAVALVRKNDLDGAMPHLLESIRLGDADGATFGLLGYCRLQRGEWASALQAYRMAQLSEPDTVDWLAGIAQCLQNLNANEEAAALLDEVIRKRPMEASYAVLRATVLLDLDRRNEAVAALELPHRLGTLPADARLMLADLHLRDGRVDAARDRMRAAFSGEATRPDASRVASLAAAALQAAEWDFAGELLDLAKPPDGEKPVAALELMRARLLIESGKDAVAGEKILRELIAADPTDPRPLLALARHLAAPADASPDALAEAELLLERAAADSNAEAEARLELARLHVRAKRYAEAADAAGRAFDLDPREEIRQYRDALQSLAEASQ
jgi:tetratricopeptide (TPR) repeat protein